MKNNYLIRNVSVKDISEIVSLCDLKIAWKEPRIFEELRSFEINSQQERKKLTISYTISTNNSRYLGRATGSQKTLLHNFMAVSTPLSHHSRWDCRMAKRLSARRAPLDRLSAIKRSRVGATNAGSVERRFEHDQEVFELRSKWLLLKWDRMRSDT